MMKPQTVQKLRQAYDLANNIINSSSSPQEALQKAGVSRKDIEDSKRYLNNPLSNFILGKIGGNKGDVSSDISKIESLFDTGYSQTEQAPVGELEALQKTLQSLK